jgi:threonine/homoserine/homoserine lactone efflux protein
MLYLRLLEVLFLGFLCGLIPGPVVTALFTETIRKGRKSAQKIVAWAAAGELVMSITCVALLSLLPSQHVLFSALSVFGSLVLLNLAWDLWKLEEISEHEPLFSSRRIFFIAVLNGMAWIFWITVCTPQAMALGTEIKGGAWIFILLFELGWILSTLTLCYLFALFRPYFQSNKKLHLLYRTVAILFVLFAMKLAIGSARSLLQLS